MENKTMQVQGTKITDMLQGLTITDIALKWELAERIVPPMPSAPKQALQGIFDGIVRGLEGVTQKKFDEAMKKRVWEHISPTRLQTLKNIVILGVSNDILGSFKDSEIKVMLDNHKATGKTGASELSERLKANFIFAHDIITDKVVKEADGMKDKLIPEMVKAFEKEGIQFPERGAPVPGSVVAEGKDPEKS
jgi:hypothetical protein